MLPLPDGRSSANRRICDARTCWLLHDSMWVMSCSCTLVDIVVRFSHCTVSALTRHWAFAIRTAGTRCVPWKGWRWRRLVIFAHSSLKSVNYRPQTASTCAWWTRTTRGRRLISILSAQLDLCCVFLGAWAVPMTSSLSAWRRLSTGAQIHRLFPPPALQHSHVPSFAQAELHLYLQIRYDPRMCIHTCIRICTYKHIHTYVYIYTYITNANIYSAYTHARTHNFTPTQRIVRYLPASTRIMHNLHMYTFPRTRKNMCTHAHTHIHACTIQCGIYHTDVCVSVHIHTNMPTHPPVHQHAQT